MLRIGLVQMFVEDSKENNISRAEGMIKKAVDKGAEIVVLPEMFNCPYDNSFFRSYGEEEGGYTYSRLSKIAKEEGISVAELESIAGTGNEGRVTKNDLLDYIKNKVNAPVAAAPAPVARAWPHERHEYAAGPPHPAVRQCRSRTAA